MLKMIQPQWIWHNIQSKLQETHVTDIDHMIKWQLLVERIDVIQSINKGVCDGPQDPCVLYTYTWKNVEPLQQKHWDWYK